MFEISAASGGSGPRIPHEADLQKCSPEQKYWLSPSLFPAKILHMPMKNQQIRFRSIALLWLHPSKNKLGVYWPNLIIDSHHSTGITRSLSSEWVISNHVIPLMEVTWCVLEATEHWLDHGHLKFQHSFAQSLGSVCPIPNAMASPVHLGIQID